jgi:hypothetical protein
VARAIDPADPIGIELRILDVGIRQEKQLLTVNLVDCPTAALICSHGRRPSHNPADCCPAAPISLRFRLSRGNNLPSEYVDACGARANRSRSAMRFRRTFFASPLAVLRCLQGHGPFFIPVAHNYCEKDCSSNCFSVATPMLRIMPRKSGTIATRSTGVCALSLHIIAAGRGSQASGSRRVAFSVISGR